MKTEEAREKGACERGGKANMKYDELVIVLRGG